MISTACALHIREAARARIAELGITFDTVDEIAGFTERYTAKLLCEPPMRGMTVDCMFALLGAIALSPMLQTDAKRLEKLEKRPEWMIVKRVGPQYRGKMRSGTSDRKVNFKLSAEFLRHIGRLGGQARGRNQSKRARKRSARNAAIARWAKREIIHDVGK